MAARIIFSSICRPGSRDANAIQIDRMCRAFVEMGHETTLTAIGVHLGESLPYRIVLLPWPSRRLRNRLMRLMTSLCVRKLSSDVLFTRSPLLAFSGLRGNLRIILELHSLPREGSRMQAALRRLIRGEHLCRIVTISRALADDLAAEYGASPSGCDIVVAHDGAEAGQRPGPARTRDGPLRVGYFGHLYPGKGMETIAALAPLLPGMSFEVYGGTEADLNRWRSTCAAQSNLTLHGHIPHAQVAAKMEDCDILIAPYGREVSHVGVGDIGRWMSPLKLFEYMAAERPIVAADLRVLREVVRHGETALLCPPGDNTGFAAALKELAVDPDLRARLGAAGRNLLEAEYTWEKRARRVLDGMTPISKK